MHQTQVKIRQPLGGSTSLERPAAPEESDEIMSYDDMIRADPLPATEPAPSFVNDEPSVFIESATEPTIRASPERLVPESPVWRVHLESREGRVLAGIPGKEQGRVDRAALRSATEHLRPPEPYCPPWLSTEFFPRVAPRRIGAPGPLDDAASDTLIIIIAPRAWPWCTIGRVFFSSQGNNFARNQSGSGVLVGQDLLLTASHLVPWGQPSGGWWMEFVPAYNLGIEKDGKREPFGSSYVESVHGVPNVDNSVDGLDCVICKLYTPWGTAAGGWAPGRGAVKIRTTLAGGSASGIPTRPRVERVRFQSWSSIAESRTSMTTATDWRLKRSALRTTAGQVGHYGGGLTAMRA